MHRQSSFLIVGISLASLFFSPATVSSQEIHPIKEGPIHEGFVPRVQGNVILEGIPFDPPQPVIETPPPREGEDTMWIPGYWTWSEPCHDFIWISGVWRRPPPGHHWIPGHWKKFRQQWVRIPGFWSAESLQQANYLHETPPDLVDEEVTPSPNCNYFWNPGYWLFNSTISTYEWVSGSWQPFDPDWVLVPAHYLWLREGYVFIPPYWDWPVDDLGAAYENIFIEPGDRPGASFEPSNCLDDIDVIRRCFASYPDYLSFIYHHYHFHPTFWKDSLCLPTWWKWAAWWCLPWSEQWGLWWWYGNPGYPQPHWVTPQYSAMITPPPAKLFDLMKEVEPPYTITPNGIVSPKKLINAIVRLTHQPRPIYPCTLAIQKALIDTLKPERVVKILFPRGQRGLEEAPAIPRKPLIDPDRLSEIRRASDFYIPFLPHRPLPPMLPLVQHSSITPPPPIHRPSPARRPELPRSQPPVYRPSGTRAPATPPSTISTPPPQPVSRSYRPPPPPPGQGPPFPAHQIRPPQNIP
ncbi:MAG: hypothetical protein WB791_05675 [Waddliaceae bacterium]